MEGPNQDLYTNSKTQLLGRKGGSRGTDLPFWFAADVRRLRQGARKVDTAFDTDANGKLAPGPDHAERAVGEEVAAHVVAGRFGTGCSHRMGIVERDQLRLLPGFEDRPINTPGVSIGVGSVIDADPKLAAVGRNSQPGVTISAGPGSDVLAFPGLALVGGLIEHDAVAVRITGSAAGNVGEALHLVRIHIDCPHRS